MVRRILLLSAFGLLVSAVAASAQEPTKKEQTGGLPQVPMIFDNQPKAELQPPPIPAPKSIVDTSTDQIPDVPLPGKPIPVKTILEQVSPAAETQSETKPTDIRPVQTGIPAPVPLPELGGSTQPAEAAPHVAADQTYHSQGYHPPVPVNVHRKKHAHRNGPILGRFWDWLTYQPLRRGCCGRVCVPCCRPQLVEFFHCYPGQLQRCAAPGHRYVEE